MQERIAKVLSFIFHPVLVPSLGLVLLFNSGFYFSMLSWEAKRFVLLVVMFTTFILPLLAVAIMALNSKFDISMPNSRDRILPLLSSSVFYYLGYILLNKVRAVPEFKLFMVASVLVIIIVLVVSFRWKISNHMAAIGGLCGTFFGLSFRDGANPVYALLIAVLVSGLVAWARLRLNKHDIWQIFVGYAVGFSVLYGVIYFS